MSNRVDINYPSSGRLSAARRIRRGFTRLAFAAALVALLVGGWFLIPGMGESYQFVTRTHEGAKCMKDVQARGKLAVKVEPPHYIDHFDTGCTFGPYVTVEELATYDTSVSAYILTLMGHLGILAGMLVAFVGGVFLSFWGFGWILSGFFQD